MRNKLTLVAILVLVFIASYLAFLNYHIVTTGPSVTDSKEQDHNTYKDDVVGISFTLPAGWHAKPYPASRSTIFINSFDFKIPEASDGPIAPIMVSVATATIPTMAQQAWMADTGLNNQEITIKGYKALRIWGFPTDSILAGRYFEEIGIQGDNKTVYISYFGDEGAPVYMKEFNSIIESLEF